MEEWDSSQAMTRGEYGTCEGTLRQRLGATPLGGLRSFRPQRPTLLYNCVQTSWILLFFQGGAHQMVFSPWRTFECSACQASVFLLAVGPSAHLPA